MAQICISRDRELPQKGFCRYSWRGVALTAKGNWTQGPRIRILRFDALMGFTDILVSMQFLLLGDIQTIPDNP